jgi:hypothetical protein
MRRRELITLLGGVAAAWPLAARAQPGERVRRVAFLHPYPENDPEVVAASLRFGRDSERSAGRRTAISESPAAIWTESKHTRRSWCVPHRT